MANKKTNPKGRAERIPNEKLRTILKGVGTALLICITTGVIFACIFGVYVTTALASDLELPLNSFEAEQTSSILYQDGGEWKEWQTLTNGENRIWVGHDKLNPYLEYATIAIEDKRFYKHKGVDWYRTGGAFLTMFLGGKGSFGGSTVTQQLIKNITDEDDVTIRRKLTEILRALEFEKQYDKKIIMEWYLNYIYLGGGCYGVETASWYYFDKDQSELTIAECAALIAVTNNPAIFSPYISKEENKTRQEIILGEMYDQGYIQTKEEYEAAKAQELVFQRGEEDTAVEATVFPWYVEQVITDVRDYIKKKYGISESAALTLFYTSGYKIYTAVDMDIQKMVDKVFEDPATIPSTETAAFQSAMVIEDPKTGHIVALSGGLGAKTQNRVTNRVNEKRPPGSSIKPIAVYGPALDMGLITANSTFDDSPSVSLKGHPGWLPTNYSNGYHYGAITVRQALRESTNTVSVQVLDLLTPAASYKYLTEKLGMTTLIVDEVIDGVKKTDVGYAALALGQLNYGATPIEMTAAYTAFVNEGCYTQGITFTRIEDAEGKLVYENKPKLTQAFKAESANAMTELLVDVVNNGGSEAAALSNMPVAGKTGTSTDNKDRWFVGYSPYYVGAVWCGYDMQQKIKAGYNPAPRIWKSVMSQVHAKLPRKEFATSAPAENQGSIKVCSVSGQRATDLCALDVRGSKAVDQTGVSNRPRSYCELHVEIEICSETVKLWNDHNCPDSMRTVSSVIDSDKAKNAGIDVGAGTFTDSSGRIRSYFRSGYDLSRDLCEKNKHTDPESGWFIDLESGFIISPGTGWLYDPATKRWFDGKTQLTVDPLTGHVFYSGKLVDPKTGKQTETSPPPSTSPTPSVTPPTPSTTPTPSVTPPPPVTPTPSGSPMP